MTAELGSDGTIRITPARARATEERQGEIILSSDGESTPGEVVQADDSRLSDARTPTAHAASHEDGGTDEIDSALDPRAYPVTYDVIASRPSAVVFGVGLFYASDEKILYRSNGASWVKLAVCDYADLDGTPSTFSPSAHATAHADGGADEIVTALDPRAYPLTYNTIALRPSAIVYGVGLYYASDENILYRSNGASWVKAAVADYADLNSIPTTFAPTAHATAHADGGGDEITTALDPRAYPLEYNTIALRPSAIAYGVGLYYASDENILYRSNGASWVKAAVADYADLNSIPSTFAPSAHKTAHEPGGGDALTLLDNSSLKAAAGVVYSKLSLAASIKNSDLIAAGGTLADTPPGRELTYNQIVANVTVAGTTEAAATTLVTASAFTFDGATPAIIEFFCPYAEFSANATEIITFWLYDGIGSIGILGRMKNVAAVIGGSSVKLERRITPTLAAHTYSVRASRVTANCTVLAGAGGAAAYPPAFIRIVRA